MTACALPINDRHQLFTTRQLESVLSAHKSLNYLITNVLKNYQQVAKWRVKRLFWARPRFTHDISHEKYKELNNLARKLKIKTITGDYLDKENFPFTDSYGQIFLIKDTHYQNVGSYFYTMIHEVAHWSSRRGMCQLVERDIDGFAVKFTEEQAYGFEEMVADLTAAKICDKYKIRYNYTATARYIWHYLKEQTNYVKILLKVNKMANKMVKFIMRKLLRSRGGGL
jgi:hypothetical protein